MVKYDTVIIIGPQGSGKGTQLNLLLQKIDGHPVSVGEMLREHLKDSDLPERQEAWQKMTEGHIVDSNITHALLREKFTEINQAKKNKSVMIFDAFPRNMDQVNALHGLGESYHGRSPKIGVIVLEIDFETAKDRCLKRVEQTLKNNGEIRKDDNEEAIQKRLNIYFDSKDHILAALEEMADIYFVDATKGIEEVHAEIMEKVG